MMLILMIEDFGAICGWPGFPPAAAAVVNPGPRGLVLAAAERVGHFHSILISLCDGRFGSAAALWTVFASFLSTSASAM